MSGTMLGSAKFENCSITVFAPLKKVLILSIPGTPEYGGLNTNLMVNFSVPAGIGAVIP